MAEMNVEYPNISDQTPEGQLRQVKDYLFLLADKLNLQDNSAEKVFQEVSKAIDAEAVATTDNEQAAKLREYANLKALIVKTGDYAISHSEEISKVFNSYFGANSEFGKYYEELERRVTENAQGVEDLFTYTAGINNENGNFGVGTKQFIKSGLLYYDENQIPVFGVGVGILNTVATEGDKVIDLKQNRLATFAADEIAFWDNGNKVAYISGNSINFPAANIRGGSIHIGEEAHNFFKVDTAGNLKIGDYFSVSSAGLAKFQSANGKLSLDLSAEEITSEGLYAKTIIGGDGIILKYGDKILGQIDAVTINSGDSGDLVLISSAAKFPNFKVFSNGIVCGSFEQEGSSRSALYTSKINLIDASGSNTVGEFYYSEEEGICRLYTNKLIAYYGDMPTIQLAPNSYGGEIIVANNNAKEVAYLTATKRGASLSLGNANDGVRTVAEYDYEGRHLYADHHHFLGKSDGLVTGRLAVSDCSAYVVIGRPTSGGYYSSVTIPSEIATGKTWQIADENCYVTFTISSDGTVTQTGNGTASGSTATPGSITTAYSIR